MSTVDFDTGKPFESLGSAGGSGASTKEPPDERLCSPLPAPGALRCDESPRAYGATFSDGVLNSCGDSGAVPVWLTGIEIGGRLLSGSCSCLSMVPGPEPALKEPGKPRSGDLGGANWGGVSTLPTGEYEPFVRKRSMLGFEVGGGPSLEPCLLWNDSTLVPPASDLKLLSVCGEGGLESVSLWELADGESERKGCSRVLASGGRRFRMKSDGGN